jgi:hypothetical protein
MRDVSLIKSYVWHGGKCFYVSTIDRDSSAMLGPRRFAETIVWEFDWEKNERGSIVYETGWLAGSIFKHSQVCEFLHDTGRPEIPQDDEETEAIHAGN